MNKKQAIFIIFLSIAFSIGKSWIGLDYVNIKTARTQINHVASKKVPFQRLEVLTSVAQKIHAFQNSLYNPSPKVEEDTKSDIIERHKKITYSLIAEEKVKASSPNSSFGLTALPFHFQLEIDGSNLPQPEYPLQFQTDKKVCYIQIALTAYERIDQIEIEISKTSEQNIKCFLGDYVYCSPSPYFSKGKLYQDPAFPFKQKNNTFFIEKSTPIKAGNSHPIWIQINPVLVDQIINCKITCIGDTKNSLSTTLHIKKRNSKRNLGLKVLNSYYPGWTDYYYQDTSMSIKNASNYNDFFDNFALSPTLLYCSEKTGIFPPLDSIAKNKSPAVIHYFNKNDFDTLFKSVEMQKKALQSIFEKEKYLASIQHLDHSYIYLYDELREDQNYKLIWTTNWLKKNGVKSKLLTTSSHLSGKEKIDVWCVLLQNYENFKHKFDGEIWIYICNTTAPPLPNFLIESDKQDYDNLYTFLANRPEIKGFLYYATNNWRGNLINHEQTFQPLSQRNKNILKSRYKNKFWPKIPWISYSYKNFNGDGYFFYPNSDGKFIPSSRLFFYHNLLLDIK